VWGHAVGGDSAPKQCCLLARMDNFIISSSGHPYSSLDANIKGHDTQIHVFCDASERAYGAVLYFQSPTREGVVVRQACSENRLYPVKKITIPRLDFLASIVEARLLQYVCRETGLDISDAMLWTDATVALSWIRSNPSRWKIFVCKRVTEIEKYTTLTQWKHCSGVDNPADYLSRSVNADQLKGLDTWWKGPAWFRRASNHGHVTRALRSSPCRKKRILLIQSYTSTLLHLCLTRQGIVPIGGS